MSENSATVEARKPGTWASFKKCPCLGVAPVLERIIHGRKPKYSGTSVIRHLDNPEHLYNPTQNFGLNGGLH